MKNYIKYFLVVLLAITFAACSEEAPSFRVKNERPTKANVQIKTVNNTENLNDVQPGQITPFKDVAEGRVDVSAEIQGETAEPTLIFKAMNDNNYTIIIRNTTPPIIDIAVDGK